MLGEGGDLFVKMLHDYFSAREQRRHQLKARQHFGVSGPAEVPRRGGADDDVFWPLRATAHTVSL